MLTRCAYFEGQVHEGKAELFDRFVDERLMPLWRQFPGATDVRVLRDVSADPHAPPLRMVLEVDYPDMATIESALASPVRAEAKEETEKLMTMFDGRIYHVIFEPKEPKDS
jgi:hypothetical protein